MKHGYTPIGKQNSSCLLQSEEEKKYNSLCLPIVNNAHIGFLIALKGPPIWCLVKFSVQDFMHCFTFLCSEIKISNQIWSVPPYQAVEKSPEPVFRKTNWKYQPIVKEIKFIRQLKRKLHFTCYFIYYFTSLLTALITSPTSYWNQETNKSWFVFCLLYTLYTSRKSLRHLLTTGVASCEEPGSAHEQTWKISREELPHPIKQRRDELRKNYFFVSLPLQCRLLISVGSCADWGWPDILGTIQGVASNKWSNNRSTKWSEVRSEEVSEVKFFFLNCLLYWVLCRLIWCNFPKLSECCSYLPNNLR